MVIPYTLYFTLLICDVSQIPSKIISLPARTLVSPYLFKRDKANPYLFSTVKKETHFSAELQKGIFQPVIWPSDYKSIFKLNSNEHEIHPAHIYYCYKVKHIFIRSIFSK